MPIKSFELEPSKENLLNTLSKNLLDRNLDVWYFARFCNAQEGKCSIAIDGKWGSGKTFFTKHVQLLIESFNPLVSTVTAEENSKIKDSFYKLDGKIKKTIDDNDFKSEVCVYYDAWSNDNDEDPILSIIYQIVKDSAQHYSLKTKPDFFKIASTIYDYFSGKNTSTIVEKLRDNDILQELKKEKEIHEIVSDFLDSLLPEKGDRLIIFIDELDRCKPDYAVRLLERVKHYFSNDRITFVFSVNIEELQHSVKQVYGEGLDAYRYLDRFFDYKISLPSVKLEGLYQAIGFNYHKWVFESVCKAVIEYCDFEIRDILKYYQIVSIAAASQAHNQNNYFHDGNTMQLIYNVMTPILVGLKMKDLALYHNFLEGKDSLPLITIIGDGECANRFCDLLLGENETYIKNDKSGGIFVSITEKLNKLYMAIFDDDQWKNKKVIQIGSYDIFKSTKEEVLKIANLLSKQANYE